MIAGLAPHPTPSPPTSLSTDPSTLTCFMILAYTPPDTSFLDEMTQDRAKQARKAAERPELRIISPGGAELAADAISLTDFQSWGCNDYVLAEVGGDVAGPDDGRCYVVLSPRDVVIVKRRDRRDRIAWLVERKRYEEALLEVERLEADGQGDGEDAVSAVEIGQRYIQHLVNDGTSI